VRQQRERALHRLILRSEDLEVRIRRDHELADLLFHARQRRQQRREVADRAGNVRVVVLQFLGDRSGVARKRIEALEGCRETTPVALQTFGGAREQLLQICAGFAVKRGQKLVEINVRGGLVDADHRATRELAGRWIARVDLDREVLQLGLGAHQQRRVAVDTRVLGFEIHLHQRLAVSHLHACDFADLGARDSDRLALSRLKRLRSAEVGTELEVALAEHWHPARKAQALI
jgi:hypothetical protein